MPSKTLIDSEENQESDKKEEIKATLFQRLNQKMQDRQFWMDSILDFITFYYEWFFEITYLMFFFVSQLIFQSKWFSL
jgi:hypothetical protein